MDLSETLENAEEVSPDEWCAAAKVARVMAKLDLDAGNKLSGTMWFNTSKEFERRAKEIEHLT